MTPAERQTVIDALEAALGYLEKVEEEYATRPRQYIREFAELNAALAIMQKEMPSVVGGFGDKHSDTGRPIKEGESFKFYGDS